MKNKNITILWIIILIYIIIKFLPFWNYVLYPINLIVTFLHEFWHWFFALITGWSILSVKINPDWSWLATTSWWIRAFVIMWWYVWSSLFWNLLLYFWLKWDKIAQDIMYFLWWLMIFFWVYFYAWIISSMLLIIIWISLIYITKKFKYDDIILSFLWVASILHIIWDFRVWPSSDLAKFSEIFVFIPQFVWMYLWLFIVILITFYNFKKIFYGKKW